MTNIRYAAAQMAARAQSGRTLLRNSCDNSQICMKDDRTAVGSARSAGGKLSDNFSETPHSLRYFAMKKILQPRKQSSAEIKIWSSKFLFGRFVSYQDLASEKVWIRVFEAVAARRLSVSRSTRISANRPSVNLLFVHSSEGAAKEGHAPHAAAARSLPAR
jgi:hypothetical protein